MKLYGLDIKETATNYTIAVGKVEEILSDKGYVGFGLTDSIGEIFIGIIGCSSFVFDLSKECHPDYVAEKLYIDSRSAKFVIDFVQGLFNREEI